MDPKSSPKPGDIHAAVPQQHDASLTPTNGPKPAILTELLSTTNGEPNGTTKANAECYDSEYDGS